MPRGRAERLGRGGRADAQALLRLEHEASGVRGLLARGSAAAATATATDGRRAHLDVVHADVVVAAVELAVAASASASAYATARAVRSGRAAAGCAASARTRAARGLCFALAARELVRADILELMEFVQEEVPMGAGAGEGRNARAWGLAWGVGCSAVRWGWEAAAWRALDALGALPLERMRPQVASDLGQLASERQDLSAGAGQARARRGRGRSGAQGAVGGQSERVVSGGRGRAGQGGAGVRASALR